MFHMFIVFDNRHSDMMIKKLESAGLGFYIKSTETEDKLGTFSMPYFSTAMMCFCF